MIAPLQDLVDKANSARNDSLPELEHDVGGIIGWRWLIAALLLEANEKLDAISAAPSGVVLQVVEVAPMTTTATGNSTSFSDVYTGVINVQSTTSRVRCRVIGTGGAGAGAWHGVMRLTGAGTPLEIADTAGNRAVCHSSITAYSGDVLTGFSLEGSDQPGVTGNRTYALQIRSTNAAGPWFINRSLTDGDTADIVRGVTTMFLEEYEP